MLGLLRNNTNGPRTEGYDGYILYRRKISDEPEASNQWRTQQYPYYSLVCIRVVCKKVEYF